MSLGSRTGGIPGKGPRGPRGAVDRGVSAGGAGGSGSRVRGLAAPAGGEVETTGGRPVPLMHPPAIAVAAITTAILSARRAVPNVIRSISSSYPRALAMALPPARGG